MTTKSPLSAAAPSAVSRRALRSRSASSSASTAASSAAGLALADLDALVLAERRRRAHADLDGEGQRLALAGEVADVELGVADGMDAGGVDRVEVPAAHRAAHGLVEHALAPDALDHDRRRHLALAKAGHAQVLAELARGGLHAPLDLLGGDLGLHAHARFGQLGDGRLDGGGHGSVTIAWARGAGPAARPRVLSRGDEAGLAAWPAATPMSAKRLTVACCMSRIAAGIGSRSCVGVEAPRPLHRAGAEDQRAAGRAVERQVVASRCPSGVRVSVVLDALGCPERRARTARSAGRAV